MRAKTLVQAPTRHDEQRLWNLGHKYVAGVDEVGRGCLAGPLTVAAVVLPQECGLEGVRDSKLLTPGQRLGLARQVKQCALAIGIGWVSSSEVDALGLTLAQRRAGERALTQIAGSYSAVVLDGKHNYLGSSQPVHTVIRGDQVCLAVSAAAIIAKVARDHYMDLIHQQFPDYGFTRHKGYGTTEHMRALQRVGPCVYHRHSYQPVANLVRVG